MVGVNCEVKKIHSDYCLTCLVFQIENEALVFYFLLEKLTLSASTGKDAYIFTFRLNIVKDAENTNSVTFRLFQFSAGNDSLRYLL